MSGILRYGSLRPGAAVDAGVRAQFGEDGCRRSFLQHHRALGLIPTRRYLHRP